MRAPLLMCSSMPPWETISNVTLNPTLQVEIKVSDKKESKLNAAKRTLESLPPADISYKWRKWGLYREPRKKIS